MSKSFRIVFVLALLVMYRTGSAQLRNPVNIQNITVNFDPLCDNVTAPVNIGSITASVINGTGPAPGNGTAVGRSRMDATFTLSAAATTSGILNCMNLFWFQEVVGSTSTRLPTYMGRAPTLPIVDPPNGGWDYMYTDGAARTMPNNNIPNFGWFIDNQPWYYNAAGQAANNNAGAGTFGIHDLPANPPAAGMPATFGTTTFDTFLVATPTMGCSDVGCLQIGQFDLLAGFVWTIQGSNPAVANSSSITMAQVNPTPANAAQVNTALTNGGFNGFTAVTNATICCPEPVVAGMWVIGALLTLPRRVRRAA